VTDPLAATAASQAARMSLQAAQQAAKPYIMVKLGRREGRAAAYERLITTATSYHYSREGLGELLAAWHAIALRAPRPVRDAAHKLAHWVTAHADRELDVVGYDEDTGEPLILDFPVFWGEGDPEAEIEISAS
jgi:hypothetical protein